MHGGSIVAHSDGPDLGATFTVTLPVADEDTVRDPATGEEPHAVSLTGLRVLVVDDEADARELLRRLLAEHGCEITCAASAREALTELAARPFDVLLTDIGMPGTDGYELLRRVRAGGHAQTKAVAVTAFARPEDREHARAAGFDGHLAKPVNPTRLLQTLATLVTASPGAADADAPPSGSSRPEALPR
jgi:CheY-like chemotaxis protein